MKEVITSKSSMIGSPQGHHLQMLLHKLLIKTKMILDSLKIGILFKSKEKNQLRQSLKIQKLKEARKMLQKIRKEELPSKK